MDNMWQISFDEATNGYILNVDSNLFVFTENQFLEAFNFCLAFLLWKFRLDMDEAETEAYLQKVLSKMDKYMKQLQIIREEEEEETEIDQEE